MQKRKFNKPWLLAGVLCTVPITTFVSGCNGDGSGPTIPHPTLVGEYDGRYLVTQGPDQGETVPFVLRVNADGTISSTITDASGNTVTASGTVNTTTGAFNVTGTFDGTGTTGQASGSLTINQATVVGTGTFELSNGNRGTVTLQKK